MMRKFAIALIAFYGVWTGSIANALGFGELTLHSALNQKFMAEIRLHSVGDLSKNEIIPNLASHEDFVRAGVERVFFLTNIQLEVVYRSQDDVIIRLTTDKIVREPFLNFLIELHWPSGRLLREFTVLLDPPAFSEVPPTPIKQTTAGTTKTAPAPVAADSVRVAKQPGNRVRIKKNDTLWSIARDNRPEEALSIRQTMLSIQKNNPQAFINNNINLIKAGQVITIPSASEIREVSSAEAIAETQRQNESWRSRELASSVEKEAVGDEPVAVAAAQTQKGVEEGQLKLVSEDADDDMLAASAATEPELAPGEGAVADVPAEVGQQLSSAPGTDSTAVGVPAAEVELLRAKLGELEKKISLKDDQLARLQASLANRQDSLSEGKKTGSNEEGAETQAGGDAGFLGNPLYIGGLIFLALAGLVIYGVISRRRSDSNIYPSDLQETLDHAQDDIKFDDGFEKEPDLGESILDDNQGNAAESEELDVSKYVEEADIYIAYGRYERAVEMLTPAVDDNPDNQYLRLKLAEIYVAMGDDAGLAEQERVLKGQGDAEVLARLEALKSSPGGDQPSVDPEEFIEEPIKPLSEQESLADLEFSLEEEAGEGGIDEEEAVATVADDTLDDLDFDLDLDLLSEEADSGAVVAETEHTSAEGEALDESETDGIDFLVDVDEVSTKLELAHTYIGMNDKESATEILEEVLKEGSDDQKNQARELLNNLS